VHYGILFGKCAPFSKGQKPFQCTIKPAMISKIFYLRESL
jgi:hypothetical protein